MGPYKGYEYLGLFRCYNSGLEVFVWGTDSKAMYFKFVKNPERGFYSWGADLDKDFRRIYELVEGPYQEDLWV